MICYIGANGQISASSQTDVNDPTYYDGWIKQVPNVNCRILIQLQFSGDVCYIKDKDTTRYTRYFYALHADTISNSEEKIIYTVYIGILNWETFVTKTGTLDEIKEWCAKPYKIVYDEKDPYSNVHYYKADNPNHIIYMSQYVGGIKDISTDELVYSEFL